MQDVQWICSKIMACELVVSSRRHQIKGSISFKIFSNVHFTIDGKPNCTLWIIKIGSLLHWLTYSTSRKAFSKSCLIQKQCNTVQEKKIN